MASNKGHAPITDSTLRTFVYYSGILVAVFLFAEARIRLEVERAVGSEKDQRETEVSSLRSELKLVGDNVNTIVKMLGGRPKERDRETR